MSDIHKPQKFKVSPHPKRVEFEIKRWLKLIKDYELIIEYHPRKANVVADALSQKSSATLVYICIAYVPLLIDMKALRINLDMMIQEHCW